MRCLRLLGRYLHHPTLGILCLSLRPIQQHLATALLQVVSALWTRLRLSPLCSRPFCSRLAFWLLCKWLESAYFDEAGLLSQEARETLKHLDNPDWHKSEELSERLGGVIKPLTARCLLKEKAINGQSLNPVARFHLGNGAELHRINWLGDISVKGIKQSAGLMVNYLCVLDNIERNHEQHSTNGTVVCSSGVRDLSRRSRKLLKGESET